jgi:hypothetical protein
MTVGGEKWSLFPLVAYAVACLSFGTIVAVVVCSPARRPIESLVSSQGRARLAMVGALAGAVVFALLSHTFYERYLIPASCFAIPALAAAYHHAGGRAPSPAAWLALALLGAFSVAGMQDYFSRNRAVWQAIAFLRERGVQDLEIDGGFEFAGLVRFNSSYRNRPVRIRPFAAAMSAYERARWIMPINIDPRSISRMRLRHCVGLIPEANARIVGVFDYSSWIRTGRVLALYRRPATNVQR